MWSYNNAVEDDKYDPEAAKEMLEAAGVKDLSMKVWAMPVARPYMLNARRAAELIQSDFDKVGVKVEIVSYEWAEYLDKSRAKDRDGAVILGWTGDNGDPDNFLDTLLGCDAVGGNNRAQWCNKEFDDLVTKAKEADRPGRAHQALRSRRRSSSRREAPWATHRPLAVHRADAQGRRRLRPEPARRFRVRRRRHRRIRSLARSKKGRSRKRAPLLLSARSSRRRPALGDVAGDLRCSDFCSAGWPS